MRGYWNRPDETSEVLRDGWLFTGDLARQDADGFFTIVDRKKDMIISGGMNVYPRDVEEPLYQNPKVREAVAVGVPDEHWGEAVKVYIVLRDGETATAQEIIDFCRGWLVTRCRSRWSSARSYRGAWWAKCCAESFWPKKSHTRARPARPGRLHRRGVRR
jgi:acyl-CoA synthetase (AMP-forming)/AMP-acid ligase II